MQNQANTVQLNLGVEATGAVPVSILRGDGTTLTSGNATHTGGTTVYTFPLTPTQSTVLDQYTAVWTPTINGLENTKRTYFEIAGEVYFAIAEAKALPGMSAIADQDVVEARQRIEELVESRHKRAYVPRGRRVTLDGDSSYELSLPDLRINSIYSISVTDSSGIVTAFTPDELADVGITSFGYIRRKSLGYWSSGYGNVSVHYVTGEAEPPDPIKRAALLMCQASFILTDSEGNPTRPLSSVLMEIPEVKELLEGWADNYVGVA